MLNLNDDKLRLYILNYFFLSIQKYVSKSEIFGLKLEKNQIIKIKLYQQNPKSLNQN